MKNTIKSLLSKEVSVLERSVPLALVLLVAFAGVGAAAVLSTYGMVTGTAGVTQAVTFGDTEQARLDATYTNVVGGDTVTTTTTVENNRDEVVDVEFDTNYTTPGSSTWESQSSVTGVETAHVAVYQVDSDTDVSGQDTYGVTAEVVDPIADGDYAVHLTSGGDKTEDYATVYYSVSGLTLSDSDVLKFEAQTGSSHDAGGTVDEIYFVTDSGELYAAHTNQDDGSQSVSVDLSQLSFDGGSAPTWSNVVAVGIGYGDASLMAQSEDLDSNTGATIDVTLDNVRVGGSNIDEMGDTEFALLETGDLTALAGASYSLDANAQYSFTAVTSFAINVVPGNYQVANRLDPVGGVQPQ